MMFSFGKERRFTHFPMMYEENTYSQYEQELWDKVAVQVFAESIAISVSDEGCAIYSCNAADAFMAERAKRLKEQA